MYCNLCVIGIVSTTYVSNHDNYLLVTDVKLLNTF